MYFWHPLLYSGKAVCAQKLYVYSRNMHTYAVISRAHAIVAAASCWRIQILKKAPKIVPQNIGPYAKSSLLPLLTCNEIRPWNFSPSHGQIKNYPNFPKVANPEKPEKKIKSLQHKYLDCAWAWELERESPADLLSLDVLAKGQCVIVSWELSCSLEFLT